MIRDILVAMNGMGGNDKAVADGLKLAAAFQSHLVLVETMFVPVPMPTAWSVEPDPWAIQQLRDEQRAAAQARVERFERQLEREAVPSETRIVEAARSDATHLALHARHADLVAMARGDVREEEALALLERFFGSLLMESGRPVLVLPASARLEAPPRHVVVAWQPTREATRALHDALPFLEAAESVDVLEIQRADRAASDGGEPGADIATHLARHGLKVRVVVHQSSEQPSSGALLAHCEQSAADLLVMGGYGHSRFREWLLGGWTREVFRSARLPVLFSH